MGRRGERMLSVAGGWLGEQRRIPSFFEKVGTKLQTLSRGSGRFALAPIRRKS